MGCLPEPSPFKEAIPTFQPCQIVCLEYEQQRLYAEVVQTVEGRQTCWVRPLLLNLSVVGDQSQFEAVRANVLPASQELNPWLDLRNGSDLLLPATLFRAVFDTEMLPLLTILYESEPGFGAEAQESAQVQLRQFVRQVWQAHPALFQT
jgi:hypothetical protein